MARILVTDGETRASLAAVRALGRSGHRVFVTATQLPSLASVSRWTSGSSYVPAAAADMCAAAKGLAELAEKWRADVVIPMTDATMGAVLRSGSRIGGAVIAGPSPKAYEAVANKVALLSNARSLGWTVPRSVEVAAPADLARAARLVGYPCVLKPHRSVVCGVGPETALGVRYVDDAESLGNPFPDIAYPVLVQERIEGPGEGVFLLMDHGRRVAAFAHRRLREKPPSGGISTYRESIALPLDLAAAAERLLGRLDWHGVAMVEFKRSVRDGAAYLMEINGRMWGSLQLAIDAGVDFPSLLVQVALGESPAPRDGYRVGVRSRWFWGDVDHLLARLRRSRKRLNLGPDAPSVRGAVWAFLRFWRGDRLEVWDRADPRPFWRETVDWFRGRST